MTPCRLGTALLIAGFLTSSATANRSASGCLLVVEETGGRLSILARDGTSVARIPIGERPHEIAVSPDGQTAYVPQFGIADYNNRIGTPGDHVAKVDLASGREIGRFVLPSELRAPHGVQLRPPLGDELFTNAEVGGDVMLVYATRDGKLVRRFPIPAATHNFAFNQDGSAIYSFAGKAGVSKLDPVTGTVLAHADIGSPARGVRMLGTKSIAVAGKGEVVILDADSLAIERRLVGPVTGQFAYLEVLRDHTIVAPSLADNGVVIFDRRGKSRFVATGKTALVARVSPDGLVYVSNVLDDHLSRLSPDLQTATSIGHVEGPNAIAFGGCPK